MTATERRGRIRAVLQGSACVHPGSVFDPLSARAAEELGFEVGMFAGSVASLAVLGAPDIVLLTLTEFAEQARRICRAAPGLPLLVDADHGYGNALNAQRTVEELEAAGVAALTIEDTELPRPFGDGATRLVSLEEGVGKVRAALAGRSDPSLVVVARTAAVGVTGVEDAIARARACEAVGPDALFFTGVRSLAQLDAIAAATRLPIILGGLPDGMADRAALAARRVRISLQGHQPFMAAVAAAQATLKALREGVAPAALPGVPPPALVKRLSREDDYARRTADWLGG